MFLTAEELHELTGYTQRARQIAQLRKMGVPFFVNAAGRPVVVKAALSGGDVTEASPPKKTWEPSWAASHR